MEKCFFTLFSFVPLCYNSHRVVPELKNIREVIAMKILIKGCRVIDPATKTDAIKDVLISEGKIFKVEKGIKDKADREIDAQGCLVMPGFIDLHVHLRDPGFEEKETIETGTKAAAKGGYTTILAMPNTRPVVDNPDVVSYVHNKARNLSGVNVLQVGAVTKGQKGEELSDIRGMVKAGIPAISEDGKSVMNTAVYREAMKIAKETGITVLAHCEDKFLVGEGIVNQGPKAEELGYPGIGNEVEDTIAARDIMLAKAVGAKLHLCHCSTEDSVLLLKHAKAENIDVTGEACPHHFTLCEDDILEDDPNYKMNPPLRAKKDLEAIRKGLKEDILDVIATDHAPHAPYEKGITMKKSPFGIVGLETSAALTYTELVLKEGLTLMQMAEKMSYNPAKVIGIDKGSLEVGKIADVVVFDPRKVYAIDAGSFASKSRNTPFHGRKVTGEVKFTISYGEVIYEKKGEK